MNRHQFMLSLFVCATLQARLALAQSESLTDGLIPSLNYWGVRNAIQQNPELRKRLEISPEQFERIRVFGRNEKLVGLFSKERALRGSLRHGVAEFYGKFDEEVKEELRKFLDESQVNRIRSEWLALEFPCGVLPFRNRELLANLDLSDAEQEKLDIDINTAFKRYTQQRRKFIELFAASVVEELPNSSRVFFAQLVGNRYLPGMPLDPKCTLENVPYEQVLVFSSKTTKWLAASESSQEVRLSARQLEEIDELRKEENRLELQDNDEAVDALMREKLPQILTANQLVQVGRHWSLEEFAYFTTRFFSNNRVVEYLGLELEDCVALHKLVETNSKLELDKLARLNSAVFEWICLQMPSEKGARVRALFKGTWDVR